MPDSRSLWWTAARTRSAGSADDFPGRKLRSASFPRVVGNSHGLGSHRLCPFTALDSGLLPGWLLVGTCTQNRRPRTATKPRRGRCHDDRRLDTPLRRCLDPATGISPLPGIENMEKDTEKDGVGCCPKATDTGPAVSDARVLAAEVTVQARNDRPELGRSVWL